MTFSLTFEKQRFDWKGPSAAEKAFFLAKLLEVTPGSRQTLWKPAALEAQGDESLPPTPPTPSHALGCVGKPRVRPGPRAQPEQHGRA